MRRSLTLMAMRRRAATAVGAGAAAGMVTLSSSTSPFAVPVPQAAIVAPLAAVVQRRFQAAPAGSTFKCSECGKGFRLQNALNHHILTKHAGQGKVIVVGPDGKPIEGDAAGAASSTPAATPQPAAAKPAVPAAPAAAGGSTPMQPKPAGAAAAASSATPSPASPPPGQGDSKLFTCTVCDKQFRLEAALLHHYQAKHNMEMPSSTAAASTAPPTATPGAATPSAAAGESSPTAASAAAGPLADEPSAAPKPLGMDRAATAAPDKSGHQYVAASETIPPQPPQYHLDVAPNAPDEIEVAVHHRCVNHILLLGAVQDVQTGYVFEEPVCQFVLVTDFDGASPGEPDKDFHTVRVHGEQFAAQIKEALTGPADAPEDPANLRHKRILVSGRVRVVPQYEPKTNKYYHFPVVQVNSGVGFVRVLSDGAASATAEATS